MRRIGTLILVGWTALHGLNAQAFCENERNESQDWIAKCDQLSAASQISGAVGGAFAILTFGASLAPAAAAIGAAHNACRIRDEKIANLSRCEAREAELTRQQVAASALELERERRRAGINLDFDLRRDALMEDHQAALKALVDHLANEGFDLDDPATQELIRASAAELETRHQAERARLEQDRAEALSHE